MIGREMAHLTQWDVAGQPALFGQAHGQLNSAGPSRPCSCCTVSTTLFRILQVTFAASCTTFLWVLRVAVTHCQHGSSLKLFDNPPSFCQLSSDCLLHSTTRTLHAFTLV